MGNQVTDTVKGGLFSQPMMGKYLTVLFLRNKRDHMEQMHEWLQVRLYRKLVPFPGSVGHNCWPVNNK